MNQILGFWGLTVLPEKTYTQIVDNSFKLSMAALDETTKPGRSCLRVTVNKKTFILCSLTPGKVEQQNLDLVFTEGEEITFSVSGDNSVHLSGNYLPEDEGMDFDDEDMYEDEDVDEDDDEEEDENVIVTKGAKRVAQFDEDEDSEEDPDFEAEDDEEDEEDEEDEDEEEEIPVPVAQPSKKQKVSEAKAVPAKEAAKKPEAKKPEAKKPEVKKPEAKKPEAKKPEAKKEEPKKEEPKKDNKKVLPNGLVIEDVKIGDGARAKSGKKIGMRYIGRLTNGKVFDKNTSGKPFHFNLGRGEVIKGWDIGIQGMQLGGERRLTIPPALAYGAQGAPPDIPRNATLTFEVKLVAMK
ncbi:peptidylprolyl isomerase fpr4 [Actinomortierella ambigua]|uniref:peptidylprolyl isomerase n=1 Tax=Actinomortierella ambigua TaxID=1343610 RepID=A0A9P6QF78_9FUNG|nr:peptidylprolyl isomerase fpr4 [Actinomortierella ambigua]